MVIDYSHKLNNVSAFLEGCFKQYTKAGLYICDLAPGGGKSYTIGKLSYEYYHRDLYNRIIILCIQNKLLDDMKDRIESLIKNGSDDASLKLTLNDFLVVKTNEKTLKQAIFNQAFDSLLNDMEDMKDYIHDMVEKGPIALIREKMDDKQTERYYRNMKTAYSQIEIQLKKINQMFERYGGVEKMGEVDELEDDEKELFDNRERELRQNIRIFFYNYVKCFKKKVFLKDILEKCPSLEKVYPQVNYRKKKVILMTVDKSMYGFDPIISLNSEISKSIRLEDLVIDKTLIIADEGDQVALSMRKVFIDEVIGKDVADGNTRRRMRGHIGFLKWIKLLKEYSEVTKRYYDEPLGKTLKKLYKKVDNIWQKEWQNARKKYCGTSTDGIKEVKYYHDIFLDSEEDIEIYRRGVFFVGPIMRLVVGFNRSKIKFFVCLRKDCDDFILASADSSQNNYIECLKEKFDTFMPLEDFLSLEIKIRKIIKADFIKIVNTSLKKNRNIYNKESEGYGQYTTEQIDCINYPTREREIETLFLRIKSLGDDDRRALENELLEFIKGRKNFHPKGEKKNIKDFSFYKHGFQFYQIEIDTRDNLHAATITCREMTRTPEGMLVDIVNTNKATVVLCSATGGSMSVRSNFDLEYFERALRHKFYRLSSTEKETFDRLMSELYPQDYEVKIKIAGKIKWDNKESSLKQLEKKYLRSFHKDAIKEELVQKWWRRIKDLVISSDGKPNIYELNRILKYVQVYGAFHRHKDSHSLMYFQNRTADNDKCWMDVTSCLIDETYKDQNSYKENGIDSLEGKLPEWENLHLRITRTMKEIKPVLEVLEKSKDAKIINVSAFNSFKAGTNLQHKIAEGLNVSRGGNYESEKENKDLDEIYIENPSGYLMIPFDSKTGYERGYYNLMLHLGMFHSRGYMSMKEIENCLYTALSNPNGFMFSTETYKGVKRDKEIWVQDTANQSLGRVGRTKNKSRYLHIYLDEDILPYFSSIDREQSVTREFKEMSEFIQRYLKRRAMLSETRINNIENVEKIVKSEFKDIRSIALYYHNHPEEINHDNEKEENGWQSTETYQRLWQKIKTLFLKYPTIENLEKLRQIIENEIEEYPSFERCYVEYDKEIAKHICEDTRFSTMIKNQEVKNHFTKNGLATEWKNHGEGCLMLSPNLAKDIYAGEIGEEAIRALILAHSDWSDDMTGYEGKKRFGHLKGQFYEFADFMFYDEKDKHSVAVDVKNWVVAHVDRIGDIPTKLKREDKEKVLECDLLVVNVVEMEGDTLNPSREWLGFINKDGRFLQDNFEDFMNRINKRRR